MRKAILTTISILVMVIMVSINTAAAEKRHIVIEMGESGQTFSFPMDPEEIATDDTAAQSLFDFRRKTSVDDRQTVAYEMAESGELIVFPERIVENHTINITKVEQ